MPCFNTLTIAIDGYPLTVPITGIGRYTVQMLKGLLQKRSPSAPPITIYTATKLSRDDLQKLGFTREDCSKIHTVHCLAWGLAAIARLRFPLLLVLHKIFSRLWAYWGISWHLHQNPPAVFWSPMHHLPAHIPTSTFVLLTVFDLGLHRTSFAMDRLNRFAESYFLPRAITKADKIVCISNSTETDLHHFYPASVHKSKSIYLGISGHCELPECDPAAFLARHPLLQEHYAATKLKPGQALWPPRPVTMFTHCAPYFLFVGTLEPRKNLLRLIRAYEQLPVTIQSQANLILVGLKGWGDPVHKALATLPETIRSRIIVMGFVNDEDLAHLYRHALFLALPSLYEGFGLPIIEALSFGIPVLTSHEGATAEVVGKAGLLVDPLDMNDIAKGLARLIVDRKLRAELASHAPEVLAPFNWNSATNEWIRIIEAELSTKNSETANLKTTAIKP